MTRGIPVIDASLPLQEAAPFVESACREVGFFYVVNHGVPMDVIENCLDAMHWFFGQPEDVKNRVKMVGMRGYFGLGEEDLNGKDGFSRSKPKTQGDWKEGFDCGAEDNQWPAGNANFRLAVEKYRDAVLGVGFYVVRVMALALGMEESFFTDRMKNPMATLRLLRYPRMSGCGEHTDYGCCTILFQNSDGLDVKIGGRWIPVPARRDAFVVNIGDMTHRWTNGYFASTLHRVRGDQMTDRYSMPLFLNPDRGTLVQSLPTRLLDEEEGSRFAPELAENILASRYEDTFVNKNMQSV